MAIDNERVGDNLPAVAVNRSATAQSMLPATILVGLVMLAVGLLAGYFGRPLIDPVPSGAQAVASAGTATPASQRDPSTSQGNPSAVTLMDAVADQTRHFRGDPDAPVTIVEFGDFQ